ncbi:MAG: hypothetical protein JJ892_06775 [Balneola sp.]|nr:hypothetical protein [Balneola sp.]MBO6651940.1 hypothetical protein [Balneola sp.]MBO6711775.1 hypothetical protein [Balneola sp.]MBO6799969.1 hypothetical protein [Balneola sp.]MBO6871214.1 hypothetical protein [Balneola sp.]
MIEAVILIAYISFFLFYFILSKKKEMASFSVLIITSGLVYVSSVISLIISLGYFLFRLKLSFKVILYITASIIIFSSHLIIQKSYIININEFLQIQVFAILFLLMINYKNKISAYYRKNICRGFLIGSLIITFFLVVQAGGDLKLLQTDYQYFNISNTFNYSAIYLFFGLIAAPYKLVLKYKYRLILFALFLLSVFIFQSRASLILGTIFFIYLNQPKTRFFKWLIYLPLIAISIFAIVDSGVFNPDDPNDILYSITDIEKNTSNIERIRMITSGFSSLIEHPSGWGVGMSDIGLKNYNIMSPHAHNVISNWLFEFGLMGVLISILFYYTLYIMYRVNSDKYSLAIVAFISSYSLVETLQFNILVSLTIFFALMTLTNSKKLTDD